jgi:hypothetical protein
MFEGNADESSIFGVEDFSLIQKEPAPNNILTFKFRSKLFSLGLNSLIGEPKNR